MDQRTILEVILGVYKLDKKYRTNVSLGPKINKKQHKGYTQFVPTAIEESQYIDSEGSGSDDKSYKVSQMTSQTLSQQSIYQQLSNMDQIYHTTQDQTQIKTPCIHNDIPDKKKQTIKGNRSKQVIQKEDISSKQLRLNQPEHQYSYPNKTPRKQVTQPKKCLTKTQEVNSTGSVLTNPLLFKQNYTDAFDENTISDESIFNVDSNSTTSPDDIIEDVYSQSESDEFEQQMSQLIDNQPSNKQNSQQLTDLYNFPLTISNEHDNNDQDIQCFNSLLSTTLKSVPSQQNISFSIQGKYPKNQIQTTHSQHEGPRYVQQLQNQFSQFIKSINKLFVFNQATSTINNVQFDSQIEKKQNMSYTVQQSPQTSRYSIMDNYSQQQTKCSTSTQLSSKQRRRNQTYSKKQLNVHNPQIQSSNDEYFKIIEVDNTLGSVQSPVKIDLQGHRSPYTISVHEQTICVGSRQNDLNNCNVQSRLDPLLPQSSLLIGKSSEQITNIGLIRQKLCNQFLGSISYKQIPYHLFYPQSNQNLQQTLTDYVIQAYSYDFSVVRVQQSNVLVKLSYIINQLVDDFNIEEEDELLLEQIQHTIMQIDKRNQELRIKTMFCCGRLMQTHSDKFVICFNCGRMCNYHKKSIRKDRNEGSQRNTSYHSIRHFDDVFKQLFIQPIEPIDSITKLQLQEFMERDQKQKVNIEDVRQYLKQLPGGKGSKLNKSDAFIMGILNGEVLKISSIEYQFIKNTFQQFIQILYKNAETRKNTPNCVSFIKKIIDLLYKDLDQNRHQQIIKRLHQQKENTTRKMQKTWQFLLSQINVQQIKQDFKETLNHRTAKGL